ncbi:MAG: M36 family metallopeptidase [Bacteroidota bacterium]
MAKLYLLALFSVFSQAFLVAQTVRSDIKIFEDIRDRAEQLELGDTDVAELQILDDYTTDRGTRHVYVGQLYEGIPVYNGQAGIHYRDGEVVHFTSNMVGGFDEQQLAQTPLNTAEQVVRLTASNLGLEANSDPRMIEQDGANQTFLWEEVANSPIRVKLNYYPTQDDRLALAWQVEFDQRTSADYWQIQISASNGEELARNNYTVYCNFDHDHSAHGGGACIDHFDTQAAAVSTQQTLADGAQYRVFPLGIESPIFGDRELVVNPADPTASPFGWHDTNGQDGAEFTYTRGNNVFAYDDSDNDNTGSVADAVDGGDTLVFDFPFSVDIQPQPQIDAAVTQLFYMNNVMHDLAYAHGFDEKSGNFQQNTYNRGGVGSDAVRAEAQDGSGTNNANFSSPPEGNPGRMQMFIWQGGLSSLLTINSPGTVAGTYTTVEADFGDSITTEPLTGIIVEAFDNSANPELVCEPVANAAEVNGNIAMILRGDCFFEQKVINAEAAGAIAVLICNAGDPLGGMAGVPELDDPGIPSLLVDNSVCEQFRAAIAGGQDVEATFVRPSDVEIARDSDFDNGIIAHEYGHGISIRLVGGPNNSGCLFNDEQMGEGWSDFFALAISPQLSLDGTEPRSIAAYANGTGPSGAGIRQQRYSTDLSVNDYAYDDIIFTPEGVPHPLGEIWNTTLWDMYWAFVEEYGFDPDLINGTGGNNLAVRLVIEGLKFTACNPGMADGRNGILAADFEITGGANQCLIWEVFARRGIGFQADQADTDSRIDGVENFDILPSCFETVKVRKEANVDNIEPGDEINFRLDVVNHKPEVVTGVQISDELPLGLTVVESSVSGEFESFEIEAGAIIFNLPDMDFEDELTVTYTVTTSQELGSVANWEDDVEEGDTNWDIIVLDGDGFWEATDLNPRSGELSFFAPDVELPSDQVLQPFDPIVVEGDRPVLRFWHTYDTETGWDGGIVEISDDGGSTWERIPDKIIRNGYRGEIAGTTFNEGVDVLAYWGSNGGEYEDVIIDLADYAGQEILVRWRMRCDAEVGGDGWYLDDFDQLDLFTYDGEACVSTNEGDVACGRVEEAGVVVGTNIVSSTFDPVLGETDIRVFPNPANDFFRVNVTTENAGPLSLELMGIDGRLLSRQEVETQFGEQQYRFDTKELPAGLYLLRARGTTELQTIKVSIQ